MEGGEALFDSRVIVEYLDTLSPVGKLIPSVGRERAAPTPKTDAQNAVLRPESSEGILASTFVVSN